MGFQESYYKKANKDQKIAASGFIHHRYINKSHSVKKALSKTTDGEAAKGSIENNSPTDDQQLLTFKEPKKNFNIEVCKTIQRWLKHNDTPLEDVLEKWKKTFDYRRNQIIQGSTSILND